MKVAAVVLSRNLPELSAGLVENLRSISSDYDAFSVDCGSLIDNICPFSRYRDGSVQAIENGLRFFRGTNFAISEMIKDRSYYQYDAFLVMACDFKFLPTSMGPQGLVEVLKNNSRVGIVSPMGHDWGERSLFGSELHKLTWYVQSGVYLFRRDFLDRVLDSNSLSTVDGLFDGNNFRGYMSESEMCLKAYANGWSVALSRESLVWEDESWLRDSHDLMRTEPLEEHLELFYEEGRLWLKRKYGFANSWQLIETVKFFYERFLEMYPDERKYGI